MDIAKLTTGAFCNKKIMKNTVLNPSFEYAKTNIKMALNIPTPQPKTTMPNVNLFDIMADLARIEREHLIKSETAKVLGGYNNIDFIM